MGDSKPELGGTDLTQAIELSTIPGGVCCSGTRLANRFRLRSVSKADAALDHWLKEIAQSTELRKWFGHDPGRWETFRRRYAGQLHQHADLLSQVRSIRQKRVALVCSAHDEAHNDAIVLRNLLLGRPAQPKAATTHHQLSRSIAEATNRSRRRGQRIAPRVPGSPRK